MTHNSPEIHFRATGIYERRWEGKIFLLCLLCLEVYCDVFMKND